VEVRNETTLAAIARLEDSFGFAGNVCAMNFASAKNPGGGVRTGAVAQEEALARASALVRCIQANPGYAENKRTKDKMYTDHMSYSPKVPVFRDDDGQLAPTRDQVRLVSFVSTAAPNRGAMRKAKEADVDVVLERRIAKTLAIMAKYGHKALVLGAYGCGVFRNDPTTVAEIFREQLDGKFRGVFAHVVFAVLSRRGENIREFEQELAPLMGVKNIKDTDTDLCESKSDGKYVTKGSTRPSSTLSVIVDSHRVKSKASTATTSSADSNSNLTKRATNKCNAKAKRSRGRGA